MLTSSAIGEFIPVDLQDVVLHQHDCDLKRFLGPYVERTYKDAIAHLSNRKIDEAGRLFAEAEQLVVDTEQFYAERDEPPSMVIKLLDLQREKRGEYNSIKSKNTTKDTIDDYREDKYNCIAMGEKYHSNINVVVKLGEFKNIKNTTCVTPPHIVIGEMSYRHAAKRSVREVNKQCTPEERAKQLADQGIMWRWEKSRGFYAFIDGLINNEAIKSSRATLYRAIKRGEIPTHRFDGHTVFTLDDVEGILAYERRFEQEQLTPNPSTGRKRGGRKIGQRMETGSLPRPLNES